MTILFSLERVLEITFESVKKYENSFEEITIIRNAEGLISLFVKPIPDKTIVKKINKKLKDSLGPFWSETILFPGEELSDKALEEFIQRERRLAPWEENKKRPRWFILERVLAKHAWLWKKGTMPWSFEEVESGKPPVVVFYSFKGGMGRTTAMLFTALKLVYEGFNVALIDLDIEAPGLTSFLPDISIKAGVLDYLLAKPILKETLPISEVTEEINVAKIFLSEEEFVSEMFENKPSSFGKLILVPAGNINSEYIQKLARLDYQFHQGKPIRDVLFMLFSELTEEYSLDFIFLDARAGFHDLCGLILSIAHQAVLFGVHSEESWNGLAKVIRFLARPEDNDPCSVIIVHSLAPGEHIPDLPATKIRKEFLQRSYDIFCEYYYSEEDVPDANDTEASHYPVYIQWNPRLLGQVDISKKEVKNIFLFQEKGYSELVEKIKLLKEKE